VPNARHYHATRQALCRNSFTSVEDCPWPTAQLDAGRALGRAQLVPVEVDNCPQQEPPAGLIDHVWQQKAKLSDIDCDTLDILSSIWLEQAKTPDDKAITSIDEILKRRGLLPKPGGRCDLGKKYRGGFTSQQRRTVSDSIRRLESLRIILRDVEIYDNGRKRRGDLEGRALSLDLSFIRTGVDGRPEISHFSYNVGSVFSKFLFGQGKQLAWLSAKAVEYDPYHQRVEKRLIRFLSWHWRIRGRRGDYFRPFTVRALLEAAGIIPHPQRIARARARLERALETLERDGVIASYQYIPARVRLPFPDWSLLIEPPESVRKEYHSIGRTRQPSLGERVHERLKDGSLLPAAEEIDLPPNDLSAIEKGTREVHPNERPKIRKLLALPSATP